MTACTHLSRRDRVPRRMSEWRKALSGSFFIVAWLVAQNCASSDDLTPPPDAGSLDARPDADRDQIDVAIESTGGAAGAAGQSSAIGLDPLCGVGDCVPDDAESCTDFTPSAGAAGAAGGGGEGGAVGASTASGGAEAGNEAGAGSAVAGQSGAAGATDGAGTGGAGEGNGSSGAGGAGGDGSTSGSSGASFDDAGAGRSSGGAASVGSGYGCRVAYDGPSVTSTCGVVGPGGLDDPCVARGDCQAGFACVGSGMAGRCRPYCCVGSDSCQLPGTYCAPRPLRDESLDTENQNNVPVCVRAENCSLAEPYPCPDQQDCTCAEGTACSVVASDGTTSCVPPGVGTTDQACPCAWGYVCSPSSQVCKKLCSTSSNSPGCGSGRCQDATYLPDGWGQCVSTGAADAGI